MRGLHKPNSLNVYRTNVLPGGRTSFLSPCINEVHIKEIFDKWTSSSRTYKETDLQEDNLGRNIFQRSKEDEKAALSIEDQVFLEIRNKNVYMNEANNLVAPLPFRFPRRRLPNNREQAAKHLSSLCCTLEQKPNMKKQYSDFMQIFEAGQAELAPPLRENQECWYLPTFGIYHPQKPDQIRMVFYSSAKHKGISLILFLESLFASAKSQLQSQRMCNKCFTVSLSVKTTVTFLRFLWFEDNDFTKPVTEYRMTVHVFGNSPSPAITIYGL